MAAATVRTYPRHTHDQYGIGVIDSGGHASSSDRGQVEAAPGSLIFVNPGEVHDGRPIGRRARSWRMLYLDPTLLEELRADVLDGASPSFTFAAPVFVDENLRRLFDFTFAHAAANDRFRDAMEFETALLRPGCAGAGQLHGGFAQFRRSCTIHPAGSGQDRRRPIGAPDAGQTRRRGWPQPLSVAARIRARAGSDAARVHPPAADRTGAPAHPGRSGAGGGSGGCWILRSESSQPLFHPAVRRDTESLRLGRRVNCCNFVQDPPASRDCTLTPPGPSKRVHNMQSESVGFLHLPAVAHKINIGDLKP